jgi:hypothetical protein
MGRASVRAVPHTAVREIAVHEMHALPLVLAGVGTAIREPRAPTPVAPMVAEMPRVAAPVAATAGSHPLRKRGVPHAEGAFLLPDF